MLRSLSKLFGLFVMVIAGSIAVYLYATHSSTEQRLHEVEQKNQQLNQIVTRLSDEKRVAEVLVTDQKTIDGVLNTTLLFVEYGKNGFAARVECGGHRFLRLWAAGRRGCDLQGRGSGRGVRSGRGVLPKSNSTDDGCDRKDRFQLPASPQAARRDHHLLQSGLRQRA